MAKTQRTKALPEAQKQINFETNQRISRCLKSPKTQDKRKQSLLNTQKGVDISELKRVVSVKFEKDIRQRFAEANYQIKSNTTNRIHRITTNKKRIELIFILMNYSSVMLKKLLKYLLYFFFKFKKIYSLHVNLDIGSKLT